MVHGEGEKEYIELILTVRSKNWRGKEKPETIRSKHDPIYTHDSILPWFFLAISSSPSLHAN